MAFSPASGGPISLRNMVVAYIKKKFGYEVQLMNNSWSGTAMLHLRKANIDHFEIPIGNPDNDAEIIKIVEVFMEQRNKKDDEPMADTKDIVNELLDRYPGHSHEIREHILLAAKQLKKGQVIGRRQTPVVSFWLMKPKWVNRGYAWKQLGTDGDIVHDHHGGTVPSILQLVYFRTKENLVCQLAYVNIEEGVASIGEYEYARLGTHKVIDKSYEIKEKERTGNDASDEILHTMESFI